MAHMVLTDTFRAAENIVSTEMDGEAVLMHVTRGKYYSLNDTGSFVWKKLEKGQATFLELKNCILDEFEVDEDMCSADLEKLLKFLLRKGIVEKEV